VALAGWHRKFTIVNFLREVRGIDQLIRPYLAEVPTLLAIFLEGPEIVAQAVELAVSNRPQFLPTPGRRESPGTPDKLMRNAIAAGEFWLCAG
jgi:hypothetical protein